MKKLISLLLTLACLCALLPAAAEEAPALNLPISISDYQQSYDALLADVVPGCTVTWTTAPMEGGECHMAMINDSFIGVMVLVADDQAQEIAILMQGTLDENMLMTFLSLSGYAGAALLRSETVSSEAACDAFIGELYNIFSAMNAGEQPQNVYGLPGGLSITLTADGSYQYYFIIKLTSAE